MLRLRPARHEHRRPPVKQAAWAALLALAGSWSALGQERGGGMPSVTPSPLNTMPPGAPRLLEAPPPPPAPGPASPLIVPVQPALTGPSSRVAPRVIEVRPDSTGFVSDLPPGPPLPTSPEIATKKVGDLIEVVGQAEGEIDVVVGRSRLIQTRDALTRIAVSNPAVADVELINDQPNTRLLNLYGRSYGTTDLTIWDASGRPTTFLVRVTIDTRDLEARLRQIFPGADVRIRQAGTQIVLEGQVPDVKTMAEVLQLVGAELRMNQTGAGGGGSGGGGGGMLGGAGGGGGGGGTGGGGAGGLGGLGSGTTTFIINRVHVPGPRQILLHVKIAELNRSAIRQIGVNWLDTEKRTIFGSQIGSVGTLGAATSGPPHSATATSAAAAPSPAGGSQLFGIFNAGEFAVYLNALRANSLAKVIAEPNLMTLDGQPAKFLAGGQFPYPVPQISSSGGGNVVTIQFAPYGALLSFLPNILAGDVIRLDVEPAFSELNNAAGTSVNGTAVPGITQRSARTVVELREGQTLAIAGLLQTSTQATTARIPGLGDIPIVGPLFSQTVINTVETELVVLVTPELVNPMEPSEVPPTAADRVTEPNDFEFFFLGRIEGKTGKDFRSTVRELDPLNVMKHFQSESHYVTGPHGYMD